ncbi:MAG TPA: SpoIIE family protein phosphatase [Pseudogracilibacillus sp.]|nr:SpoIIE family protein phosphatase [Pseudogracilibacillus sp.]
MQYIEKDSNTYKRLLSQFLTSNHTSYLEEAKAMSVSFVRRNIYPEEIVRIHMKALESLCGEAFDDYKKSMKFLLEALIAYRRAHSEFESLRMEQIELKTEIQVAANMQKTLLSTEIPHIEGIDIGAISVPLHQMNGDYYHFITGNDGSMGVAIADVIGKGVPAALSMSMIKYAMDSFDEEIMSPSAILRNLNAVVERNVASNMFITMFYGHFLPESGLLKFASAGHEPGFIYRNETNEFEEIKAKGLVLGVLKNTAYRQYELTLKKGDMIVLLTDGVTECRWEDRFVNKEEVISIIKKYADLPAQEHVEKVYDHFNQYIGFDLRDDFTLIIIKKMF